MIPLIIGAAAAGAVAYKFFGKERHDKALQEDSWTRIIPESEVPPDVLAEIQRKQLARQAAEKNFNLLRK